MFIDWDVKSKLKTALATRDYFDLGAAFWLVGLNQHQPEWTGKSNQELYKLAAAKLQELGLEKIFYEIEMPLVRVLAAMEELGIGVDQLKIQQLINQYRRQAAALTHQIKELAGEDFNLNSPQQLSRILFEKLRLPVPTGRLPAHHGHSGQNVATRTPSAARRSTNNAILQQLQRAHPMVDLVIRYRECFKLLSTYLEPWSRLGDRIHTTFLQTSTATGRISSQNPNLQNIPLRLRSVFVPAPGYQLVSFDYSQIELRILASVTSDPAMTEAFQHNRDIHQLTASQVFKVPLEDVTAEMREVGKTLNFGVVYGMGAAAFARTSGMSRGEAAQFIDEYFLHFTHVRRWHEEIRQSVRERGYVENLNGRRRWLLDIFSSNPRLKAEAERAALNMPIQSLAADIIKLAMIQVFTELRPRLVLTIHDELLFEIEDGKLETQIPAIRGIMESAYQLTVPLQVKTEVGRSYSFS